MFNSDQCSLSALSTIGFGDMVPRKGREPSSGIQTLELVIRALYIILGLALVSSLLSAAAEVFDKWNVCGQTKLCVYQYFLFNNSFLIYSQLKERCVTTF